MLREPYTAVRAVVFDAVGTLLHADPAVHMAYGQWGRRFGSRYSDAELLPRFRAAFARQERWDAEQGQGRTSPAREIERWRAIVAETLDDATDFEAVFAGLWRHFGDPAQWRVDAAAAPLFDRLRSGNVRLAVASNFDDRLTAICRWLPPLDACDRLFVSSQLGYRKPAAEFFAAVQRALELSPQQILLVGDDLENDYLAARRQGWQAVWIAPPPSAPRLAPTVTLPPAADTVASLAQLADMLWEKRA